MSGFISNFNYEHETKKNIYIYIYTYIPCSDDIDC